MRRLVVLLAFSAGITAFAAVACGGGNDKAPLTPDNVEVPPADLSEAGAPEAPTDMPTDETAPSAAPTSSAVPAQ